MLGFLASQTTNLTVGYGKDFDQDKHSKQTRTNMLNELAIRNAKPKEKTYKLSDGDGLYLVVTPQGNKWWHFMYRFENKSKKISLGVFPEVPLRSYHDAKLGMDIEGARDRSAKAQQLLAQGINPSEFRKTQKQQVEAEKSLAFKAVAEAWYKLNKPKWTAGHAATVYQRIAANVFPYLGTKDVREIKAPELLTILRRIESRGANETAHRVHNVCNQIFDYAIACGQIEHNPSTPLTKALAPVKHRHLPSITDPDLVGGFLRAVESYQGGEIVRSALRFGILTFVRPGELRQAEWKEINFETRMWSIPAERMKMKQPHLVPLSRQALEILNGMYPVTGNSQYVFPTPRNLGRPLSNNAVLAALRTMGFERDVMCGHGVRAMARTLLDEVLHQPESVIEQQLAHAVRDPLGRAYNRTHHLDTRIQMMQLWSDFLDHLRLGGNAKSFVPAAMEPCADAA